MARTWFAGYGTGQTLPPSKDTVRTKGDPTPSSEGALSSKKSAVIDHVTAQQTTPTKAVQSDYESDRSVIRETAFSSPQKILKSQPAEEGSHMSANLAKIAQQQLKPKDTQTVTTSKPVGMMDKLAPSSSVPLRAPTAQMVPLPSNSAVTTTIPATPETSTIFPFNPSRPNATSTSNSQVLFPPASPKTTSLTPTLPSSSAAVPSKKSKSKRTSTPKTPQITLTPAAATAASAFEDPALASHIQNTKLLTPMKQPTNGVRKRQYVKKSSPLRSALTPESIPDETEKRARGRPRTRSEEQPHPKSGQQGLLSKSCTPVAPTGAPKQPNSSSRSVLPSRQPQTVALRVNRGLHSLCSEEPRLWPGRGDYVTSLLRYPSKPETIHCEPIQACANRTAHEDPLNPYGHGVCTTCRHSAHRLIHATRPELLISAWWPLCKTCGDRELLHFEPSRKGCSCPNKWLCFSCQMEDLERWGMKNRFEAEYRRRTIIGVGTLEGVRNVLVGWACDCGREIGSDATLMKCIGCQGIRAGNLDPREATVRERFFRKTALAWT